MTNRNTANVHVVHVYCMLLFTVAPCMNSEQEVSLVCTCTNKVVMYYMHVGTSRGPGQSCQARGPA